MLLPTHPTAAQCGGAAAAAPSGAVTDGAAANARHGKSINKRLKAKFKGGASSPKSKRKCKAAMRQLAGADGLEAQNSQFNLMAAAAIDNDGTGTQDSEEVFDDYYMLCGTPPTPAKR